MYHFSDLSNITILKCGSFKFWTVLEREEISYRWGFPFKIIIRHNSRNVIIRMIQESESFLWKKEIARGSVVKDKNLEYISSKISKEDKLVSTSRVRRSSLITHYCSTRS